jgi:manganese transport protein
MKPVLRRLLTRGIAVIPAVIVAAVMGDKAVGQLLVISQVGGNTYWLIADIS